MVTVSDWNRRHTHGFRSDQVADSTAKPGNQKVLIAAVLGVIVVGAVAWNASRALRTGTFDLETAKVVSLDVDKRTAEIEFIHPKTGRTMKATGTVPPDCDIAIDGKPASLADVRIGDVGSLRAVSHGKSVEARRVRIRRATSNSAPASQPASPSGL
jgi:hypothetical protein